MFSDLDEKQSWNNVDVLNWHIIDKNMCCNLQWIYILFLEQQQEYLSKKTLNKHLTYWSYLKSECQQQCSLSAYCSEVFAIS